MKVFSGRYYQITPEGITEMSGEAVPDIWVCRRLEDCPDGEVPPGAASALCTECGAVIVFNPQRPWKSPKSCMQCNDIEPSEIPPQTS